VHIQKILVDLKAHCIVDLLPNRPAAYASCMAATIYESGGHRRRQVNGVCAGGGAERVGHFPGCELHTAPGSARAKPLRQRRTRSIRHDSICASRLPRPTTAAVGDESNERRRRVGRRRSFGNPQWLSASGPRPRELPAEPLRGAPRRRIGRLDRRSARTTLARLL